MFEQIIKLTSIHGVSGNEVNVCEYIKEQIIPFVDKIYTDALGNLIAVKKGAAGGRLMFMAHMDEIGLVTTFVDKHGFVRVAEVGSVTAQQLLNTVVIFENGVKGIFTCSDKNEKEKITVKDCYVDIFAAGRKDALDKIDIGMTAKFLCNAFETDDMIVSGSLDDRLGCYILIEVLKRIKSNADELYFVFTTQEEVGLRGAKISGFDVSPDVAVAVDVTSAAGAPDCQFVCSTMGGGAAIKIRDASAVCNKDVVDSLEAVAIEKKIKYQRDLLVNGGTDIGAIQTSGRGAAVGGVSVAVRGIHTPVESVAKSDIEAVINLICAYIEKGIENKG